MGVYIVDIILLKVGPTMKSLGTNFIKVGGICHSVTILPILYIIIIIKK